MNVKPSVNSLTSLNSPNKTIVNWCILAYFRVLVPYSVNQYVSHTMLPIGNLYGLMVKPPCFCLPLVASDKMGNWNY